MSAAEDVEKSPETVLREARDVYGIDLSDFDFLYSDFSGRGCHTYRSIECSSVFRKFLVERIKVVKKKKEEAKWRSRKWKKLKAIEVEIQDWINSLNYWIREFHNADPEEDFEESSRVKSDIFRLVALHSKTSKFMNFSQYDWLWK